ncbi:MAG: hypothetical protein ACI9WR_000690 [Paracoccaceae bacterium]|jgi:hypothetical protein
MSCDYFLYVSSDLSQSVEKTPRAYMDAARKHWGSFEGFVAYVTGSDETATRQLEKVICDRWETGYQVERAEWENHQSGGE